MVCSDGMRKKSIRLTSVQTVQPVGQERLVQKLEPSCQNVSQDQNRDMVTAASELTEEKLLEHDNVRLQNYW